MQQFICKGLFYSVYEYGLFHRLLRYVVSVNGVVCIETYSFGKGASDKTETDYSYFHHITPNFDQYYGDLNYPLYAIGLILFIASITSAKAFGVRD